MTVDVRAARSFASAELAAAADPTKAPDMQAYMKTDMPFYGVQKTGRTPILRALVSQFVPANGDVYERLVLALWELPHREEKYLALGVARYFEAFITPDRLDLYRRLIVEGAWWDLVDEVATKLIRHLVTHHPKRTWPVVDTWVDDPDIWLRRTAIICQVGAKEATDARRLLAACSLRAHETDFFIRKAIGWALREYAKTDPEAVAGFINAHAAELSTLSYREGSKHIPDLVDPR